jgi:ABC-type microcin C transport system permease subunit YejB
MNTNKIQKYLLKLKDSFLEESEENKKMLDVYIKFIEGEATEDEIEYANNQLNEIFKSLGLGVLTILPFSPITIPYVIKKAQELGIDIIPNWYKKL